MKHKKGIPAIEVPLEAAVHPDLNAVINKMNLPQEGGSTPERIVMKVFTLTNVERMNCYVAVNLSQSGTRGGGYTIDENLLTLLPIMNALKEGVEMKDGSGGKETIIDFQTCDEKKAIKLRRGEVDRLISCLKKYAWPSAMDALNVREIIQKLEDAPDEKEPKK